MFPILAKHFAKSSRAPQTKFFGIPFMLDINGSLLAFAFASGGPCFHDCFVDGPNPYQPLMQRLEQYNEICPLWALPTQERLVTNYDQREPGLGSGIPFVLALCGRQLRGDSCNVVDLVDDWPVLVFPAACQPKKVEEFDLISI